MRNPTLLFGFWLFVLFLTGPAARAQTRVTLSGTVKDAKNGEDLIGASVRIAELPGVGTGANAYGFYSLTVPAGSYTLEVEGIHEEFVEGSSVGPGLFIIALPGTAPPPSAAIAVAAGEDEDGHDITLIDTLPRFDDFETVPGDPAAICAADGPPPVQGS